MLRHRWIVALLSAFFAGITSAANAQRPAIVSHCPYTNHERDLACLIPSVTVTGVSTNLGSFNTALAQVIGELPLAVPISGFALTFDKTLGIPVVSAENLGSVLTERGDTIGKHKLFLGFTFQRFVFDKVDGVKLNHLPIVFEDSAQTTFGSALNSLSANVNQFTAVAAFGLTDRIDVSFTLPFERVSLSARAIDQFQVPAGSTQAPTDLCQPDVNAKCPLVTGQASGPGDLILNVKATVWKSERFRLGGGAEVRFPTGDEFNLLGSGAYGLKPYVVFSRRGRVAPHANLGYQWNSFSVLYPDPKGGGGNLRLPDSLQYSAGVDVGIVKRLTVVADLLGQHYFRAPRVTSPAPASQSFPDLPPALAALDLQTIGIRNFDSYDQDNLGLGIKVNPVGRLIVSANVLIKLNDGGLRANYVPLVGISYKF